jgi:putative membrane protein
VTTAHSEISDSAPEAELRLHPLSWLFELFNVLKQFIVPLAILLIGGRGNQYELWGLVGVAFMVPLAVARYITFRYRISHDRIVIRSGLVHKTVRDIAFTRIQNVSLHQGLLHRLMGVAEVRLETGGGKDEDEGRMRVLSFAAAQQLQGIIRSHEQHGVSVATSEPADAVDVAPLLQLGTWEVVKHGIISNKGMLLVAAAMGGLWQFDFLRPDTQIRNASGWLFDHRNDIAGGGPASYIVFGAALLICAFALLRMISIVQALLYYHGFTLRRNAHQLSIERGLLNRFHGALPRSRIQAWTLRQGFLHRRFKRFALNVDAAAGKMKSEHLEQSWPLAPIADAEGIARVVGAVLPNEHWPIAEWRPLHPKAWQREFKAPAIGVSFGCTCLAYWAWPYALLLAAASLALLCLQSKQWAKYAGYAHANGLIAVREGWISKHWRFAQVHKLQAVYLKQSPFDHRNGMATVFCDTVNAGSFEPALAVRYLPFAEAQELHRTLSAVIAK